MGYYNHLSDQIMLPDHLHFCIVQARESGKHWHHLKGNLFRNTLLFPPNKDTITTSKNHFFFSILLIILRSTSVTFLLASLILLLQTFLHNSQSHSYLQEKKHKNTILHLCHLFPSKPNYIVYFS